MIGENYGNKRNGKKRRWWLLVIVVIVLVAISILLLRSCLGCSEMNEAEIQKRDSAIVAEIQRHSRLYTAEVISRKTITYSSQNKLSVSILGKERSMRIPFGKTTATIPVNVTYKAYINLDKVSRDNIIIDNKSRMIHITLPDPVIVETAVSIDHENEKMDKEWFGKKLTYEEYQTLVRDAKEQAWQELSEVEQREITETAKVSAGELLIPYLVSLGFENILIEYRPSFSVKDVMMEKR